jgi:hypothetical protein
VAEKVAKLGIARNKEWMLYVKDGAVWQVRRKLPGVPKGRPEMVSDVGFEMDNNYIYFVDKDGDVSRAARMIAPGDDDEEDEDEGEDLAEREVPPAGPGDTSELLYTLFPDLGVPSGTKDIRLIQEEAERIFEGINRLEELDRLTPRQLEELLAETFYREGYESHLTPAAKDGGRDVIAVMPGPLPYLVVAEAKKMRLVKPTVVQALWGVQYRDKANMGLVATTGRFSNMTREMVQKTWGRLVNLRDGKEFVAWIRRIKSGDSATRSRRTRR